VSVSRELSWRAIRRHASGRPTTTGPAPAGPAGRTSAPP